MSVSQLAALRIRPRRGVYRELQAAGIALMCLTFAGESPAKGVGIRGMTGLLNTPTAETLPDAAIRFGVSLVDKRWVYSDRGLNSSEMFSATIGFHPRLELSLGAAVQLGSQFPAGGNSPKVDRIASARLKVLEERGWPAIAFGIDDPLGTRSHHSLYLVGTKKVMNRLSLSAGYGAKLLKADRHILKGGFGGLEFTATAFLSTMIEFDTEKWNCGFRTQLGRLQTTLAFLDMNTLSGGIGWMHRF